LKNKKNAWWQHFKILIGCPIEILWDWDPTKNFEVLEPITQCMVAALQNSDWAPHRNCMGVGSHEEFQNARTHHIE
jgi:hypothetical protein